MRENRANREIVAVGGLEIPVEYYSCSCRPDDASRAWQLLPEKCREETVIVALPGDPPNPCTIAVVLLHSIEAKARGARIRKLPVLFLMELLGLRQARDVAERIRKARFLIAASLSEECLEEASRIISEKLPGVNPVSPPECDLSEVWETTTRSILSGRRLG
ncbi:MAG: hypothetical protein GSR74_04070 [Desulfurococcales archaeon]|nr:hypothetical protein [Desulfurococcales archaeon]